MTYTKDDLRQIFQKPFNANEWQQILQHYFHATELRAEPELIDGTTDDEQGYYLGAIDTTDSYRIGLFYYKIQHGNVARKRVGLRNLVKSFVNPNWGEFDAALVVFDNDSAKIVNSKFVNSKSLWRLSFICDIKGENTAAKRFTYVFGESDDYYNTPVGRFEALQRNGISFENIKDAFSVERLNKDFFNGYKERYVKFLQFLDNDTKDNRDYVKKLLGRLVFLQFLQKKGWMGVPANQQGWNGGDKFYLNHLIERYEGNNRLLSDVLEPLFFETLNKPRNNDLADSRLGENIKIPYLNGGLFDKDTLDKKDIDFPYSYFKELMDFFAMYNFTIDENDPEDSEIGIDPEMLGHIFENLLEDNKDKGAYYTPKEIVQYMCQQSIVQYIKTNMSDKICCDSIEKLIKEGIVDPILQTKENATELMELLKNVKICDPAIGSGAFPMGTLYVLYYAIHHLHSHVSPNCSFDSTQVKREIIQSNIFGVDIEQGAVDIARLRFWLALVVDADEPQPLPNLDYKITCGNSQLCRYSLEIPIKDVFEEYNRVEKEKAHKENKEWEEFTLDSYRNLVMDYTEEHLDKDGLRTRINEIKNCFKTTLAKGDITKRKQAESKVYEYEFVSLFGKRKADEDPVGYVNAKNTLRKLKDKESEILNNKKYENSFEWRFEYPQLLDSEGNFIGFDIVIANPPYIKEGRMSKTFFEPYKNSPYYKGKMDIWYLFACNGLDLLNEKGVLCFIATNNWVTSFGASKLRNKVIKETRISNIVDFGAVMMFESASIQTMIMLFQKDSVTDDYSFDYRRLTAYKATEKDATAILSKTAKEAEYFSPTIRRANFIDKSITFSKSADILEQIVNSKDVIYLYDKEIAQGIVFPQDRLNKKNQQKLGANYYVGQGVFVLTEEEKDALMLNSNELSLVKPYYTSENVERYVVYPSNYYWAIYTDSKYKHRDSLKDYPKIKAHLDRFSSIMTSDNKPYGLHRAREERFFTKEKIVVLRKCVEHPVFSYCNFDCYLSQSFNMIQTDRVNMKYLTGLLNSRLIEFWLKNKGKMQGANYQLDKEPLMQIPIAVPDKETQELVVKLVDYIIYLSNCNNQEILSHTSNKRISFHVEEILDMVFYELYFEQHMKDKQIDVVSFLNTYTWDNGHKNIQKEIESFYLWYQQSENPIRQRIMLLETRSKDLLYPIHTSYTL